MKEIFSIQGDTDHYYVDYCNGNSDQFLAQLLNIPLEEYYNLLLEYNAFSAKRVVFEVERLEFYFARKNDCQKFCDYLNEKYGTMLKLVGD